MKLYFLTILVSLVLSNPAQAEESLVPAQIAQKLEVTVSSQAIDGVKPNWKRLQTFYAARQYKPCWPAHSFLFSSHAVFSAQAQEFVKLLDHADKEGLIPEDYAATRTSACAYHVPYGQN